MTQTKTRLRDAALVLDGPARRPDESADVAVFEPVPNGATPWRSSTWAGATCKDRASNPMTVRRATGLPNRHRKVIRRHFASSAPCSNSVEAPSATSCRRLSFTSRRRARAMRRHTASCPTIATSWYRWRLPATVRQPSICIESTPKVWARASHRPSVGHGFAGLSRNAHPCPTAKGDVTTWTRKSQRFTASSRLATMRRPERAATRSSRHLRRLRSSWQRSGSPVPLVSAHQKGYEHEQNWRCAPQGGNPNQPDAPASDRRGGGWQCWGTDRHHVLSWQVRPK